MSKPPPAPPASTSPERSVQLFCLGADSGEHLIAEAARWNAYVTEHRPSLQELSRSMHAEPSFGPHRLALLAANIAQVQTQLRALQKGGIVEGAMRHVVPAGKQPKIVWMFSGDGSQYPGMGRALFHSQPAFREAMQACDQALAPHLGGPLTEHLYGTDSDWLQPAAHRAAALFAVQYSAAQLWRSLGVQPTYVMGYSAGEIAAATVSGALSLHNGVAVLMARTKALQSHTQAGGTAFVFAPRDALTMLLRSHPEVSIAAYHGGESTVVAGAQPAFNTFLNACQTEGMATQKLTVDHAVHSPWVEPVLPALRQSCDVIAWDAPQAEPTPWVSLVTGATQDPAVAHEVTTWCDQLRKPVQFAATMHALSRSGTDVFIEVGPSAGLLALGRQCVPAHRHLWLASMRRDAPDWKTLLESLGVLHTVGAQINLQAALDPCFWRIVS